MLPVAFGLVRSRSVFSRFEVPMPNGILKSVPSGCGAPAGVGGAETRAIGEFGVTFSIRFEIGEYEGLEGEMLWWPWSRR